MSHVCLSRSARRALSAGLTPLAPQLHALLHAGALGTLLPQGRVTAEPEMPRWQQDWLQPAKRYRDSHP